jgi:outer membrane protein assembly factor BamB
MQRITQGAPQPLVLDRSRIVVAEPLDHISCWTAQQDRDNPLQQLWRHHGRAMTTQTPQMMGLVAGDVDQDGSEEVLYVQETREGHSRLVAMGLNGVQRWHCDFPSFSGRAPIWNECGTTIWAVGHFTDTERLDVMVSNRRSIMHSDETVVLDSQERKIVWRRDILDVKPPWTDTPWPHTRGYGGAPVAVGDLDGDGTDEIVLAYPAEYSVVRGKTGEQYIVENKGPLKGTDNFWVFGGWPLIADLDGDNEMETLLTAPSMIIAFVHRNGRAEILWRTEPDDGANGLPAIGDTNGDGRLEIGLAGFQDGFRCLDAATGEVLWTVPSHASEASNCIAVDIDADGYEEFLYANGNRILAVAGRSGLEGAIVWQIDLPAYVQNIAVADTNGDGKVAILAGGSNGVLYCVE